MVTRSRFQAEAGDQLFEMALGDALLIPPGCVHRFTYPTGSHYLSFKFRIGRLPHQGRPCLSDRSGSGRRLCMILNDIVPDAGEPRGMALAMTEHLLAALVIHHYGSLEGHKRSNKSTLTDTIEEFVRQQGGRRVTVRDVAEQMKCSVSSISSRFREEKGASLKQWLDSERGDVAERLLMYSDMNASQIAYHMGFPDLFSFSRFCRRVLGESPRSIKKGHVPRGR